MAYPGSRRQQKILKEAKASSNARQRKHIVDKLMPARGKDISTRKKGKK